MSIRPCPAVLFLPAAFAMLAAGLASAAEKTDGKPTAAGLEFFESKIRPVLVAKCYECHSADSKELKGNLAVDTRNGLRKGGDSGPSVIPGNVKGSVLIEAIRREGIEMPPDEALAENVVADFVKWIEMGAPDPRDGKAAVRKIDLVEGRKHWAFQPVAAAPTPPQVADAAWPRSDIDRYVLAALEAKKMTPAADADPVTLLRRVTLDLTGLQPTPAEIDDFVSAYQTAAVGRGPDEARDHRSRLYEAVVDRMLASLQFGERWGRHWLDVARYGESTGKERNVPYPLAWRYRDYVIDSLNADKPYDEFIREQVAGDLLPAATPAERNEHLIATGFLALGPKSVNERNAELYNLDVVDEQIDVVCRAVMATTVACARCHDHKFDPIPQTDYYALAGIFRSTDVYCGVSRGQRNFAAKDFATLDAAAFPDLAQRQAAQAEANKDKPESLAGGPKLTAKEREKLLKQYREADEKFDELRKKAKKSPNDEALAARAKQAQQEFERLRDALGGEAAVAATAAATKAKKNAKDAGDQNIDLTLLAMAVREGKPTDVELRIRGEESDKGPAVKRGFLSVLQAPTMPQVDVKQSGRLQLAEWLTQQENPLTARVLANRIWFHLFGAGLVETIDNFGALGEKPSHPELLDALARYVMDHDWSVKQTIRAVVLSRAYQMSSEHDDANYAVDPSNRLVWRMNRRRLDAEVIRDTAMAASDRLNLERPNMLGEPTPNGEIGRNITLKPGQIADTRRSVYLQSRRGLTDEMLALFDAADNSLVVGQREVTTVATQALFLLNSPFILDQADGAANRVLREAESAPAAHKVDLLYRLILARPAAEHETARGVEFVRGFGSSDMEDQAAWSALAQVLFSSAEFRYVY